MSPEQYVRSTVADALGWAGFRQAGDGNTNIGPDVLPASLERKLLDALTGGDDLDSRYPHYIQARSLDPALPDLHDDLAGFEKQAMDGTEAPQRPRIFCARWPGGRPFGLLLSHDIDQIHDREMWRILADINHIRRVWQQGERGNVQRALGRVGRALFRPKPATKDYKTILEIEGRHGFRSTFFVLHDRYWARHGARFSIHHPEMLAIVTRAKEMNCEIAVHGGYYRFNDAALYRQSREEIGRVFSVEPQGIRNHLLRYSYPCTWRAQAEAGFQYDATYGYNCRPGPRSGLAFPFFAYDRERQQRLDFLVLPLTIMDTTLYRYFRLEGKEALDFTWALVERYARCGGLITLLWHGNFFNEPEYADWQCVYEKLLALLAPLRPYCATGAEINRWWRSRAAVRLFQPVWQGGRWLASLEAGAEVADLVLDVRPPRPLGSIEVHEFSGERIEQDERQARIWFPRLSAGTRITISL